MRRLALLAVGAVCAALTVAGPAAPAHAATAPASLPLLADWEMKRAGGRDRPPARWWDATGHGFDGSLNVNAKLADGDARTPRPRRGS